MKLYTVSAVARETGDDTVTLVCDPDKLFYLSAVYIDKVNVHKDVQQGARLDYVRTHLNDLPPIVVVDGTVVDGAHRVAAARADYRELLRAFIMIDEIVQ